MQGAIIISIDHGNRAIKTKNFDFPSSFREAGHLPALGSDVLSYNDKEYHLEDTNQPPLTDKTADERYFILTLFAIGKELPRQLTVPINLHKPINVELLVGLPLTHMMAFGKQFKEYFLNRRTLNFSLNGKLHSVVISNVHVYPQAYAAALSVKAQLEKYRTVNIVDIGGHTVDCFRMTNLRPSKEAMDSLDWGVSRLFNEINERTRAKGKGTINFETIESILREEKGAKEGASQQRLETIVTTTEFFTDRLIQEVQAVGLDIAEDTTVFVGGGAMLLQGGIRKSPRILRPIIVENIRANVLGYELIHKQLSTKSEATERHLA